MTAKYVMPILQKTIRKRNAKEEMADIEVKVRHTDTDDKMFRETTDLNDPDRGSIKMVVLYEPRYNRSERNVNDP